MITLNDLKNIGHGEIEPEPTLDQVKQNGHLLQYVHNQTPEICEAAVKQNGLALLYVHNQTPEICEAAVKQNGFALRYVDSSIFKEDPKEMTLSEVSELLGYDVKIVK